MNKYFVYLYIDPITKIPFYCGMGQGNRHLEHLKEAILPRNKPRQNHDKLNKILSILNSGLKPNIIKIDENIGKDQACELESFVIDFIGRLDLKTGPLTNQAPGGIGGDLNNGKHFWNNGTKTILSKDCPGPEYSEGMLKRNKSNKIFWNNGEVQFMSERCPGEGFVKGRLNQKVIWWTNGETEIKSLTIPSIGWSKGRAPRGVWWNNGSRQILSVKNPGTEWTKGMLENYSIGRIWWNNGIKNTMCKNSPGPEWKRGQIDSNVKDGRSWWNNSIEEKLYVVPPDKSWSPGRLPKQKNK